MKNRIWLKRFSVFGVCTTIGLAIIYLTSKEYLLNLDFDELMRLLGESGRLKLTIQASMTLAYLFLASTILASATSIHIYLNRKTNNDFLWMCLACTATLISLVGFAPSLFNLQSLMKHINELSNSGDWEIIVKLYDISSKLIHQFNTAKNSFIIATVLLLALVILLTFYQNKNEPINLANELKHTANSIQAEFKKTIRLESERIDAIETKTHTLEEVLAQLEKLLFAKKWLSLIMPFAGLLFVLVCGIALIFDVVFLYFIFGLFLLAMVGRKYFDVVIGLGLYLLYLLFHLQYNVIPKNMMQMLHLIQHWLVIVFVVYSMAKLVHSNEFRDQAKNIKDKFRLKQNV